MVSTGVSWTLRNGSIPSSNIILVLTLVLFFSKRKNVVHITDNFIGRIIYIFLNEKYFLDILYNNFIFLKGFRIGYSLSKYLDRGVIELIGPHGLTRTFLHTGFLFSKLDTLKKIYLLFFSCSLNLLYFSLSLGFLSFFLLLIVL